MYLIVGLGNPEKEYGNTRHNVGFDAINELARINKIEINKNKFKGLYGQGIMENEKVILLKPQTYMNLSGESIQEIMHFYKIPVERLIVIYDDIDIEEGVVKIRKNGGPGTHNGMKSVIQMIGTQNFARIRIGIGKPEDKDRLIEHVIGKISKESAEILEKAVLKSSEAIIEILKTNIEKAMNKIN